MASPVAKRLAKELLNLSSEEMLKRKEQIQERVGRETEFFRELRIIFHLP